MKKILLALFLAGAVQAEDIYVSQSGAGTQSGASAANAHSMTWFNTSGNWDTDVSADAKIGPGDVVHFSGTITTVAQIQGSGSSGNRITLKIDPGAKFSTGAWPSTGAIAGTNVSHITIEGSNPAAGDGTIVQTDLENTNNGTGLGSQSLTRLIYIAGNGSNITCQNLVVKNVYVRTYGSEDLLGQGTCIRIEGNDNLLIENCYLDNAETGCNLVGNNVDGSNTGLVVNNNWIMDCANGVKMSTGVGSVVQSGRITRNRIDKLDRWSTLGGDYHLDGIQSIGDAGGIGGSSLRDTHIAYNHIGPALDIAGRGSMTSPIFWAQNTTGTKVYNNWVQASPGVQPTNEFINIGNQPVEQGYAYAERNLVANNTLDGITVVSGDSGRGMHAGYTNITGNIFRRLHEYHREYADDRGPTLSTIIDRNLYYGTDDLGGAFYTLSGPGQGFKIWGDTWQALGFDVNGKNGQDPLLNSNGTLQTGSPAIGMAATQTVFTDDFNGVTRTGSWDAGAFEFSGDTTAPTPNPMTFSSAPAAVDAFSVTMTATTASDVASPTISYFFDETTGNPGGTDSGWIPGPGYIDSGLSASTNYTYRVKARDSSLNETSYSSGASATTSAAAGGAVNIETINVTNLRVGAP